MSDISTMFTLSTADFVRFLTTKSPDIKCHICGQDNFALNVISPAEGMATLAIPVKLTGRMQLSNTHDFFSISCQNCGNSSFFHRNIVDKWIIENPTPPKTSLGEDGP